MYHKNERWKSTLHNVRAQIKSRKYGRSQKDNVELRDYTADRPDNCQFVSLADSRSAEKRRFYQLLSQQVYLYSGVKRKEACCLHVALNRSYQLHRISHSWEMNPQIPREKLLRETAVKCIHWQDTSVSWQLSVFIPYDHPNQAYCHGWKTNVNTKLNALLECNKEYSRQLVTDIMKICTDLGFDSIFSNLNPDLNILFESKSIHQSHVQLN